MKDAWISLGGVILSTTGSEALFADVGHFSVRSIKISMCAIVYPACVLACTGHAAFLRKNNEAMVNMFYKSIREGLCWRAFIVAILASLMASEANDHQDFFSDSKVALFGMFSNVKVIHTSSKHEGRVYIPEVNYLLMFACIGVTPSFKTTTQLGKAYGVVVVSVMTLTSFFMMLIMIMLWKTRLFLVMSYIFVINSVEVVYLSSVSYKFLEGGYLPMRFAIFLMSVMYNWNHVHRGKYYYEQEHRISSEKVREIISYPEFCRTSGLGIFYFELINDIPPILKH